MTAARRRASSARANCAGRINAPSIAPVPARRNWRRWKRRGKELVSVLIFCLLHIYFGEEVGDDSKLARIGQPPQISGERCKSCPFQLSQSRLQARGAKPARGVPQLLLQLRRKDEFRRIRRGVGRVAAFSVLEL